MSTPMAPSAPAQQSFATNWNLAGERARERVIRLQEQRTREAASQSRILRFFDSGRNGSDTFRVGQLDAELLDEELLGLLKQQLWSGLKYFRPSLKETYEPELLLLLRGILFKLTIWDHNATYGAGLQNLHYTDARKRGPIDHPPSITQKSLYGLFTVGGRYLHSRLNLFLLSRSNPDDSTPWTTRLSNILDTISTMHSTLSLLSFTAFLITGHYRTLLDRVLRMRLVPPNRVVSREVSFEYLNRQLVWHAFTEFLLFILPLLRVGRWRRWWARVVRKLQSTPTTAAGGDGGELGFLPERTCAICYKETNVEGPGKATDITNPYEAVGCGHVYCYVCLQGKIELEEGEGWTCLRCGHNIKRARPWRGGIEGLTTELGDWGEETMKNEGGAANGKEVGFEDDYHDGDVEDEGEIVVGGDGSDVGSEETERPRNDDDEDEEEEVGVRVELEGEELEESAYNISNADEEEILDSVYASAVEDDDEEE